MRSTGTFTTRIASGSHTITWAQAADSEGSPVTRFDVTDARTGRLVAHGEHFGHGEDSTRLHVRIVAQKVRCCGWAEAEIQHGWAWYPPLADQAAA